MLNVGLEGTEDVSVVGLLALVRDQHCNIIFHDIIATISWHDFIRVEGHKIIGYGKEFSSDITF